MRRFQIYSLDTLVIMKTYIIDLFYKLSHKDVVWFLMFFKKIKPFIHIYVVKSLPRCYRHVTVLAYFLHNEPVIPLPEEAA